LFFDLTLQTALIPIEVSSEIAEESRDQHGTPMKRLPKLKRISLGFVSAFIAQISAESRTWRSGARLSHRPLAVIVLGKRYEFRVVLLRLIEYSIGNAIVIVVIRAFTPTVINIRVAGTWL
jgi:hypothetical protein